MSSPKPEELLSDRLVPEQLGDRYATQERRLMLAVLRDALDCYQRFAFARDEHGRSLFADAATWVDSPDRRWPFSYENICDALGLDAAYVRRGLSRWHRRRKTSSAARPARIVSLERRRNRGAEMPEGISRPAADAAGSIGARTGA